MFTPESLRSSINAYAPMLSKKAGNCLERLGLSSKNIMRRWVVYLVVDRFHHVCYVGCTCNVKTRSREHAYQYGRSAKFYPLMSFTTQKEALIEERNWIRRLINAGCRLENEMGRPKLEETAGSGWDVSKVELITRAQ